MDLLEVQEQFQKFLLAGNSEIVDTIFSPQSANAAVRLGIYRDAYQLRLIEALTVNFPAVYAYLGTEQFTQLCKEYIRTHPSSFRSIRWFGDLLADFVGTYFSQYTYLTELTDFEWKMSLAFDATDSSVVLLEEMAEIPVCSWPTLQFFVHPSVQRMSYYSNAISLWQAIIDDRDGLPDVQTSLEATEWILWRTPKYQLQFYGLTPEEAWALDNLMQNYSFADLCEGLCKWSTPETVSMQAASYLKGWIHKGLISKLIYK